MKTHKDDTGKYGRYIASVIIDEESGWTLNELLVEEGHAQKRVY